MIGKSYTSYIRMTLGCLMSFMVEISRFICKQQQHERVKSQKLASKSEDKADRPSQTTTHTFQRKAGETTKRPAGVLILTGGPTSYLIFRRFHFSHGGGSREISERRQILTQRDLLSCEEKCRMWSNGKEREIKFHRTSKRVSPEDP